MIVYHGSETIIRKPVFGGGKRTNDYGPGFYTTENPDLAKEWACSKNSNGFANKYEFQMDGLKVLNLNDPAFSILNWLSVLAKFRSYWQKGSIAEEAKNYLQEYFFIDPDPYDVIIGYRADDSYFTFAQDFVAGTISLRKLSEAMHLGKLGEQVVLKSKRSFSRLHFLEAEPADALTYYEKKVSRDLTARRDYRNVKHSGDSMTEIFILDIMREGMKHGDPRLQ